MKYIQNPIKLRSLICDVIQWWQDFTYPKVGKMKDKHLIYAAYTRCPCGHGMVYPKNAQPYGDTAYWDCSAILKGVANIDVKHEAKLPFTFYSIKSENQPSANGATTRPEK